MISAIITAISGIIGVLIGSYITFKKLIYERKDKYLFAALDQKLKAHQEALNLCWDLPSMAHNSGNNDAYLKKCEKWFRENCLYLEPEARKAFFKAYRTAWDYKIYLDQWRDTGESKELKNAWTDIISVISIIEENVSKPLIKPSELIKKRFDFKGKIK